MKKKKNFKNVKKKKKNLRKKSIENKKSGISDMFRVTHFVTHTFCVNFVA